MINIIIIQKFKMGNACTNCSQCKGDGGENGEILTVDNKVS
jgi:hypothetical protein